MIIPDRIQEEMIRYANRISVLSPDPSTKIGAFLLGTKKFSAWGDWRKLVIGTGFNRFPVRYAGKFNHNYCDRFHKYEHIVHGEIVALHDACQLNPEHVSGSILCCNFPICTNCATTIIEYGISQVLYPHVEVKKEPGRADWVSSTQGAIRKFELAGVKVTIWRRNGTA